MNRTDYYSYELVDNLDDWQEDLPVAPGGGWKYDGVDEALEFGQLEAGFQTGFHTRAKFLLISTLLACLVVGGILSRLDFFSTQIEAETQETAAPTVSTNGQSPALFSQTDPVKASGATNLVEEPEACLVSDRFPPKVLRWCGLISQNASKRGIPPNLVAALILQESGGNPAAYSQSGAVGLMQVMPSDGIAASFTCVSGPCFSNRPSSSELKDPAFNISYGTKMLAGLVNKNGSLREGLKTYGPMDVGYYYADKVIGIYQKYGD